MAAKIVELAELVTLTGEIRAAALRGEHVDFVALNRLENTSARLRSSMGLGGHIPLAVEGPLPSLRELLRGA
jgi:hypothetical protein